MNEVGRIDPMPMSSGPRPTNQAPGQDQGDERELLRRQVKALQQEQQRFQRQVKKRQTEQLRYASQELITGLLPHLDHLELAVASAEGPVRVGLEMVLGGLYETLAEHHVRRECPLPGSLFDSNLYEAASVEPSGVLPSGSVVRCLQAGYVLHDRLLRPARVVVSE